MNDKPQFTIKTGIGCSMAILSLLVTTPIWYWLMYQVLVRVNATPTMWVFFWIYVPTGILIAVLKAILEGLAK